MTRFSPLCTRGLPTRLFVAYICQAIYGFDKCDPGHTQDRLFGDDHPYNKMWEKITSFYERNGYANMTDPEIEALFHKYALNGMKINRNGVEELIPAGVMYQAQAFWKKCSWTHYEKNRSTRRRTIGKISMKVAMIAAGVAIGGPLGGAAAAASPGDL